MVWAVVQFELSFSEEFSVRSCEGSMRVCSIVGRAFEMVCILTNHSHSVVWICVHVYVHVHVPVYVHVHSYPHFRRDCDGKDTDHLKCLSNNAAVAPTPGHCLVHSVSHNLMGCVIGLSLDVLGKLTHMRSSIYA